jgi:hypothetical protein
MKSYRIHTIEDVPQDKWAVLENAHEAIIDKNTLS